MTALDDQIVVLRQALLDIAATPEEFYPQLREAILTKGGADFVEGLSLVSADPYSVGVEQLTASVKNILQIALAARWLGVSSL